MTPQRQYRCLKQQVFMHGAYRLEPVSDTYIQHIREWRNGQLDVLRQSRLLTEAEQISYFNGQIFPSMEQEQPSQILFGLFYNDAFIGYGGLVHIAWRDFRGEVSFLVDTGRASQNELYRQDFLNYLELIKMVAFDGLGFNRIFTETYDIRPFHISILEESGFRLEGTMREHVCVNATFVHSLLHGFLKSDWYATT